MKRLQVVDMGEKAQGVRLRGDKHGQPEPEHFRVTLPFGDVDIARCDDDSYWIHFRVNKATDGGFIKGETKCGTIMDARVDCTDKHASETLGFAEPLNDPALYHMAIRLGPSS